MWCPFLCHLLLPHPGEPLSPHAGGLQLQGRWHSLLGDSRGKTQDGDRAVLGTAMATPALAAQVPSWVLPHTAPSLRTWALALGMRSKWPQQPPLKYGKGNPKVL